MEKKGFSGCDNVMRICCMDLERQIYRNCDVHGNQHPDSVIRIYNETSTGPKHFGLKHPTGDKHYIIKYCPFCGTKLEVRK